MLMSKERIAIIMKRIMWKRGDEKITQDVRIIRAGYRRERGEEVLRKEGWVGGKGVGDEEEGSRYLT